VEAGRRFDSQALQTARRGLARWISAVKSRRYRLVRAAVIALGAGGLNVALGWGNGWAPDRWWPAAAFVVVMAIVVARIWAAPGPADSTAVK
jgi:hypothetical protein